MKTPAPTLHTSTCFRISVLGCMFLKLLSLEFTTLHLFPNLQLGLSSRSGKKRKVANSKLMSLRNIDSSPIFHDHIRQYFYLSADYIVKTKLIGGFNCDRQCKQPMIKWHVQSPKCDCYVLFAWKSGTW